MTTINLIMGDYTPMEASEILLNLVDTKINFYKIKNLSSQVGFSKPCIESELKIRELKEAREQIISLTQEASDKNSSIELESFINMALDTQIHLAEQVQRQELVTCN